jgi:hypothetical protein
MYQRTVARLLIYVVVMSCVREADAAAVQFSGIGGNNTSFTAGTANAAMLAFEAAIGGANNGANPPATTGFRSISWDGVHSIDVAPNLLPANYFNTTSPRGVVLVAPGAGVEVSASAGSGTPARFGNINANYTTNFGVFSPERLFTPIGTNVVVINFYAAGTNRPAFVHGFGAVSARSSTMSSLQIPRRCNITDWMVRFSLPFSHRSAAADNRNFSAPCTRLPIRRSGTW